MTSFMRKSFSVPLGVSDSFRDNYDRIFSAKTGGTETPQPEQSVRNVLVAENDLRSCLDLVDRFATHITSEEAEVIFNLKASLLANKAPSGF